MRIRTKLQIFLIKLAKGPTGHGPVANLCSWITDKCLECDRTEAERVAWAFQTEVSTPANPISMVVHLARVLEATQALGVQ